MIKKIIMRSSILGILLGFLLFIAVISITVFMIIGGGSEGRNNYASGLDGLPDMLTNEMIIGAVKTQEEYGVPAALTLAQIIVESSGDYPGGLSGLAYECKNLFGMKGIGTAGYKEYRTGEQTIDGQKYTVTAKFRKYHNFTESIVDHAKLLTNSHYRPYTAKAKTSDDWAYAVKAAGYATATDYAPMLINIMEIYDLYRFDGVTLETLGSLLNGGSSSGSYRWPLPCKGIITSEFGGRDAPTAGASSNHQGLDIAAASGTKVYAADGGIVEFAGVYGSGGNTIIINHGNGAKTLYMHLRHGDGIMVVKGAKVKRGQVIGHVGSTGVSTGAHLHFQININGIPVDPLKYVKQPL